MKKTLFSIKNIQINLFKQAVKFGLVGVLNTALTLFIIWLLYSVFKTNYYTANAIGYLAGFTNSFVLNKIWTFESKGNVFTESLLFIFVFFLSYGVQVFVLWFCMSKLNFSVVVSQGIAMCGYTGVNFLGNKFITFGGVNEKAEI